MNKISRSVRKDILDDLRASEVQWNGRLSELAFLKRIFPIEKMPSTDMRFQNMEWDIKQHREFNHDWPYDWVYDDSRLDLMDCSDEVFLRFLCEMVHPLVRLDKSEVARLVSLFNDYLEPDGIELYQHRELTRGPIFLARHITSPINLENAQKINSDFARGQLKQCDKKMAEGDYYGVITNARSLVEAILDEIYFACTKSRLEKSGDLRNDYKKVKNLLNLSEEKYTHDALKGIVTSFNSIIECIDLLSNKMGDRHRPVIRPEKHHAKLVVDSAKTLCDFLFSTLEYQNARKTTLLNELLTLLDGPRRALSRSGLLKDESINKILAKADGALRAAVKSEYMQRHEITNFRTSDIFFAIMKIFIPELDVDDVFSIYVESETNDQAIGWEKFYEELVIERPDLVDEFNRKLYES